MTSTEANFYVPTGIDNKDERCLGCGENLSVTGAGQHILLECVQNLSQRVEALEGEAVSDDLR